MSLPTSIYSLAAIVLLQGLLYHGSVVAPARVFSTGLATRVPLRLTRGVYALMAIATAALLVGYLHDAVVIQGGLLAALAGWGIALVWWVFLGKQLLALTATAISRFRGWNALQREGAMAATAVLGLAWLILAGLAVFPFTI